MQQKNECGHNEPFNPHKNPQEPGRHVSALAANDNFERLTGGVDFADPGNDNEAPTDRDQDQYSALSSGVVGKGLGVRSGQFEEEEIYMAQRPDDEHGIQELDFSEKNTARRGFLSEDVF